MVLSIPPMSLKRMYGHYIMTPFHFDFFILLAVVTNSFHIVAIILSLISAVLRQPNRHHANPFRCDITSRNREPELLFRLFGRGQTLGFVRRHFLSDSVFLQLPQDGHRVMRRLSLVVLF